MIASAAKCWPTIEPGDALIFWRMPWLSSHVIDLASHSKPVHHCAIAIEAGPAIYEAWQPRVRRVDLCEYQGIVAKWASNWRYALTRKPLLVEVWRHPFVDPYANAQALSEAIAWLGTPYSMIGNWLLKGPKIHCSEFLARVLIAAGLIGRADAEDRRGRPKEPSRWTPLDVRTAMVRRSWRLFSAFEP